MAAKFEDVITLLETKSAFDLAHHMPEIKEGMADLARRVQALEKVAGGAVKTPEQLAKAAGKT